MLINYFGDDCRSRSRSRNGVVVGLKNVHEPIAPVISNNVDIGANAVVLIDVPDSSLAVGVSAIIKQRSSSETKEC